MSREYDVILRGGQVVDGSGGPAFLADVALTGNRIARVAELADAVAGREIDVTGLVVAPGFIDLHSHADLMLPALPTADSLVMQGITTAVTGQCGLTPAPLGEKGRDETIKFLGALLDRGGEAMPWDRCATLGGYLEFLTETGISINIAPLAGQGVIRASVMGYDSDPPDEARLTAIRARAEEAMDHGAVGISTGLIYPPGSWSSTDELVDIARAVGRKGGIYFSHIRGEGDTLLQAVGEALEIGRRAGIQVQISHFKAAGESNWDKSAAALEMIASAADEGQPVGVDMYPYTAGSTALSALLPLWAHEGGREATLARLGDPAQRRRMADDMRSGGFAGDISWDLVLIIHSKNRPDYIGGYVSALAGAEGAEPVEWVFDALKETGLDMVMATFGMSEDNRRAEMSHPMMTFGTDGFGLAAEGPTAGIMTHPRSFGAYPRILGRYVREQGVLTLEEAVRKMTGRPAFTLALQDRGLVREGLAADLTVFDPKTVIDTATYERPHCYPRGMPYVLVAGQVVVDNGRHTGARPGRLVGRGK